MAWKFLAGFIALTREPRQLNVHVPAKELKNRNMAMNVKTGVVFVCLECSDGCQAIYK